MAATTRTECIACGGGLKVILNLGSSPLADHFPLTPEEDGPSYPLRMAACTVCSLAQLLDVVDDGELYGRQYGFHTSGSPALLSYYHDWARWAMDTFHPKFVVDIGCNDGTLLQNFRAHGVEVLGVDPSGPAAVAAASGIEVLRQPFNVGAAGLVHEEHGFADLITAVNVAAHVKDPVIFLRGIEGLLSPEHGYAVIEFQDFAHLVAGCQFDHVYHEHRQFYSLHSFRDLAARARLHLVDAQPTPGQGGSIRAVLRKGAPGHKFTSAHPAASVSWAQLDTLQERAEFTRYLLHLELDRALDRGTVAGYGASAKSATLLNFCGIGPQHLDYIEDATRAKAGRLTPGTHIPIVMPQQRTPPGTYLLLAWNYLGQVLQRERQYTSQGGKFIVPIPVPVTI